jgi:TrmH family RNA methyltransferase
VITSPRNPRVAEALQLRRRSVREDRREFLAEGPQVVLEALAAGAVQEVFVEQTPAGATSPPVSAPIRDSARRAGVPVHDVSTAVMRRLATTVTPQGVVAVCGFVDVPETAVPSGGMVPVLVEVRDPGNAGTILRSADAAGAAAVVVVGASVDVYNEKAVRASAGSLFHLPVVRGVGVDEVLELLRSRGLRVLASAADGARTIHEVDLTGGVAVLFGNEARGLPAGVRAAADDTVRIPIHGLAESLNLAAAASVVLFESARQRVEGGGLP